MRHFPFRPINQLCTAVLTVAISSCAPSSSGGSGGKKSSPGLVLKNLMTAELAGVDNTEVVVSRVTIPPNTSLPKHWHPGEEFAYVIEGSVTLWQKGKPNVSAKAGDAVKVPLRQVHTAMTGDEGVELLIFRVHEQGKPERIPAD